MTPADRLRAAAELVIATDADEARTGGYSMDAHDASLMLAPALAAAVLALLVPPWQYHDGEVELCNTCRALADAAALLPGEGEA